jgi:c-di-GMP-binding flagellar brake protein YcgR
MPENEREMLEDAAARNSSAILGLPSAGATYQRRARLVGTDPTGFWVEVDPQDRPLLNSLIQSGQGIDVVLRVDRTDMIMRTPALKLNESYPLNEKHVVPAMLLAMPKEIIKSQRRRSFRVPLAPDDGVGLRLWRINEYVLVRDKPLASQEIRCEIRDLSAGGLRCQVYARGFEALRLTADQRLRVELTINRNEYVLEARIRHPSATQRDDAQATLGLEFVNVEKDVESKRIIGLLTKFVAEVQRSVMRRRTAA